MTNLLRHMTRAAYFLALSVVALTLLASAPFALAQSATSAPSQDRTRAAISSDGKPAAQMPDSRINAAEVTKRVNQELGIDLGATIADWQRQLDLLEKELGRPRLRYSDLNVFRDAPAARAFHAADLSSRLQPRLQADKAQIDLFGPAPAAGQPAGAGANSACPRRTKLSIKIFVRRANRGQFDQSADRQAAQRDPGHPPQEFFFSSVSADTRRLRL